MVGTVHRAPVLLKREETVSVGMRLREWCPKGMRLRLEVRKKHSHGLRGQVLCQLKNGPCLQNPNCLLKKSGRFVGFWQVLSARSCPKTPQLNELPSHPRIVQTLEPSDKAKPLELETQSPGRPSYFRPSSLGPIPPLWSGFSSTPASSFLNEANSRRFPPFGSVSNSVQNVNLKIILNL
jgi:hypothetical protein